MLDKPGKVNVLHKLSTKLKSSAFTVLNKAKTWPSLTLWSKGCQSNQLDFFTNVQIFNCDCWHCQCNNKEQCDGWAETRESMTTISHKEKHPLQHHSRIGRHQVSEWPLKHFQVKQYIYDSLELRCYFLFDLIWIWSQSINKLIVNLLLIVTNSFHLGLRQKYFRIVILSDCSRRVCKDVINNKKLHQYLQSHFLHIIQFYSLIDTRLLQYNIVN